MAKQSGHKETIIQIIEENASLVRYAIIALLLAVVAAGFLLFQGSSSGVQGCNGIILGAYRDACISRLAYSSANATLCASLPQSQADACIDYIAQNTSDASLCHSMSTDSGANSCLYAIANETGNAALCEGTNMTGDDACITELAVRYDNESLCADFGDSWAGPVCVNSVALASAIRSRNAAECTGVTNSTNVTTTQQVAGYSGVYAYTGQTAENGTAQLQESLNSPFSMIQFINDTPYSARDLCYVSIAEQLHAPQYCTMIANATIAGICSGSSDVSTVAANATFTANVSALSLGATLCKNLTLSAGVCSNFTSIYNALESRNVSVCQGLTGVPQYQCYTSIAHEENNTAVCSYIVNATANAACVDDVQYSVNASA